MAMFKIWANCSRGAVEYTVPANTQDEAVQFYFKNIYREGFHYGGYMVSLEEDVPQSKQYSSKVVKPARSNSGIRLSYDFSIYDYMRDLVNRDLQINENKKVFSLENLA